MMKKFRVAPHSLLFYYLVTVILMVGAFLVLIEIVFDPMQDDRWFAALWVLAFFVVIFPKSIKIRYAVIIDEAKLTFKSLISEKTFEIADLMEIKTSFGYGYFLYFKFRKTRISMINKMDGLAELITAIKVINSNVRTKGC